MSDTYQVAFLINVNSGSKISKDDGDLDKTLSTVRLSVLKLLTYFGNQLSPTSLSKFLRWGCRFYNPAYPSFSQKINFCDFSKKSFEDFELKLESVFEAQRKEQTELNQRKRAAAQLDYDRSSQSNLEEDLDLGKTLKNVLTSALHDFQWERPDITSPVRSSFRRKNSKVFSEEPKYHNFVWILDECPHLLEDVKKFTLGGCKHDRARCCNWACSCVPALF